MLRWPLDESWQVSCRIRCNAPGMNTTIEVTSSCTRLRQRKLPPSSTGRDTPARLPAFAKAATAMRSAAEVPRRTRATPWAAQATGCSTMLNIDPLECTLAVPAPQACSCNTCAGRSCPDVKQMPGGRVCPSTSGATAGDAVPGEASCAIRWLFRGLRSRARSALLTSRRRRRVERGVPGTATAEPGHRSGMANKDAGGPRKLCKGL